MARAQFASLMDFVSQYLRRGVPDVTDNQLIDGFVSRRDEAAFTTLVQRHGPMVLGVCRQVLRNETAAEDAFQATFLVLARKAGSIRRGQAVGSWLYQVAHRLALRARARDEDRQQLERQTAMMRPARAYEQHVDQDLCPLVHEEVRRLPEKYQAPVVLCYLEGKTAGRAAEQLGWRESVVRGRLFQARALLRARLARRGIALSAWSLGAALAGQTAVALPPALAEETIRAALAFGASTTAGGVSVHALALAEGMVRTLARSRLSFAALVCVLVGSIGLVTGVVALQAPAQAIGAGDAEPEPVAAAPAERGKAPDAVAVVEINIDAVGEVTVAGRKEPLATVAQANEYLKERCLAAAKAARRDNPDAEIQTTVRVTVDAKADYLPAYRTLSIARKVGFTRLELRPFAKPIHMEPEDRAIGVIVKSSGDGVNDGALSALIGWTTKDGEIAFTSVEELGKWLKQIQTAQKKTEIVVGADCRLKFKHFREVMDTCYDAGFERVVLELPPDLAVDPADPPFADRPIEDTEKTPRPEGTGEKAKATAVAAGLAWLAQHQAADGGWSMHAFHRDGKCNCTGVGGNHPIGATAFGLLPFLRAGQTHQKGVHAKRVEAGLKFLMTHQGKDGGFGSAINMYSHALATMALCEAYARTDDAKLKGPAHRAINYIVAAQHQAGGWRYTPRIPGDMSVTGWQIQALRWGHLAGLPVPETTWKKANGYLDSVSTADGSGYGYQQPNAPAPTMTATGLLCRAYLLDDFLLADKAPKIQFGKGVEYLSKLPPSPNFKNSYYYYYATMFMNQEVATGADDWNMRMRQLLLTNQDWGESPNQQHQKGSWSPEGDAWGGQLGRLAMTSLALMSLSASDPFVPRNLGPAKELEEGEVEKLWADLSGSNGVFRASQASQGLAGAAKQSMPFLKQQLQPVAIADPKVTAKLVADLDSANFDIRERATQELEKLGETATTALQRALDEKPPLEIRVRVEALLNRLEQAPVSAQTQQQRRAIRVLEQIGTPEAREVLETLAGGAAGARLTRTAKVALDRLQK
ncbi:hypothetical protein AYO44_01875 [Planctomycetaceae bacterium SCGC AG-212-F19]|nr:hypothetical protein AYO44_01875 [Planctomycetaceae bacterium SCGC AG-212-F19]